MNYTAFIVALATLLLTNADNIIETGKPGGPKLYEENALVPHSAPNKNKNVTVNLNESIHRITITDLNTENIAKAQIVDRGEGNSSATINNPTKAQKGYYIFFGSPNTPQGKKEDVNSKTTGKTVKIDSKFTDGTKSLQDMELEWNTKLNNKDKHENNVVDKTLHNRKMKPYYPILRKVLPQLDIGGFKLKSKYNHKRGAKKTERKTKPNGKRKGKVNKKSMKKNTYR